MVEFMQRCFELDMAGWIVLGAIGAAGYTLISQMLGDHMSAVIGAPILMLGAAIGNASMADLGVVSTSDKVLNMSISMTGGMLAGAIVVVAVLWGWNALMAR